MAVSGNRKAVVGAAAAKAHFVRIGDLPHHDDEWPLLR